MQFSETVVASEWVSQQPLRLTSRDHDYGERLMSMQFDAAYYMNARPDVLTAFVNSGAERGTGLTWPA